MKIAKRILACALVSVSLFAFTACSDPDTSKESSISQTENTDISSSVDSPEVEEQGKNNIPKEVNNAIKENKDIKAGAKIDVSKNEQTGEYGFTYENPDGTGGGGVVMD